MKRAMVSDCACSHACAPRFLFCSRSARSLQEVVQLRAASRQVACARGVQGLVPMGAEWPVVVAAGEQKQVCVGECSLRVRVLGARSECTRTCRRCNLRVRARVRAPSGVRPEPAARMRRSGAPPGRAVYDRRSGADRTPFGSRSNAARAPFGRRSGATRAPLEHRTGAARAAPEGGHAWEEGRVAGSTATATPPSFSHLLVSLLLLLLLPWPRWLLEVHVGDAGARCAGRR